MSRFTVHEHDALKAGLHHDLRLERDGVLKSWAVPKGIPEETGARRRAVEVEDHDLEYRDFQGEIPEGLYGAGIVKIWDRGTYKTNLWSDTKIEMTLHGKRLSGDYILRWIEKMNTWLLWKR